MGHQFSIQNTKRYTGIL